MPCTGISPPLYPPLGPHVDDVGHGLDHVQVEFNDHDRVASSNIESLNFEDPFSHLNERTELTGFRKFDFKRYAATVV